MISLTRIRRSSPLANESRVLLNWALDEDGAMTYLRPAMLRRLLALLAICAGLAAVAEPARASMSAVENVRLVEQAALACGLSAPAQFAAAAPRTQRSDEKVKICPRPVITIAVPTVMLQGDRAHE